MRVLAIDPGYERVGIAILEKNTRAEEKLLYSDCFKTSSKLPFPERLSLIGREMERLIQEYDPTACAIEKLYFNTNQKTGLKVSEARGMMLYIASKNNLSVYEYTPLQVKIAVTGDGRGDKKQVITMVKQLIAIDKEIRYDDEFDAIAIGLTCLASEKKYTGLST